LTINDFSSIKKTFTDCLLLLRNGEKEREYPSARDEMKQIERDSEQVTVQQ